MINHLGRRICVTEHTLDALDVRGYLIRDKESGLKRLSLKNYLIFIEAERATAWWHELGNDCSGPNVVVCKCSQCLALTDMDDSRLSPVRAEQLIAEIRQRRRAKKHHALCS